MKRKAKAPKPVARPVPGSDARPHLATPEQRAFARAFVEALRKDLAAFLTEKRRAANL